MRCRFSVAEVMFDKRGHFVECQPGQFFPHDDTSPQWGNGLKSVAQQRHADQKDAYRATVVKIAFGQSLCFQQRFIGQFVCFVEPYQQLVGLFAKGGDQALERFAVRASCGQSQASWPARG